MIVFCGIFKIAQNDSVLRENFLKGDPSPHYSPEILVLSFPRKLTYLTRILQSVGFWYGLTGIPKIMSKYGISSYNNILCRYDVI